jgi:hypothetical protein
MACKAETPGKLVFCWLEEWRLVRLDTNATSFLADKSPAG